MFIDKTFIVLDAYKIYSDLTALLGISSFLDTDSYSVHLLMLGDK